MQRPNRFYEIDQPPSRRDFASRLSSGGNSDQVVGGTDAAVDGSTIEADANKDRKDAPNDDNIGVDSG